MRSTFRPVLLVLAVLVLMLLFSGLRRHEASPDNLPWRKDLQAAKQEASAAGKPLLLYFTATWCGPCQAMASEVWPQPQVAKALESVIPVKIDVDQHPEIANQFQVTGIPRLQLSLPDGTLGPSRVGYVGAQELVAFLRAR